MEITEEITNNLKQLKGTPTDDLDPFLVAKTPELGYQHYEKGVLYEDGSHGLLVGLDENHNKYNDGVYVLRHMLPDSDGNRSLVLEVLVPNQKSKDDLIARYVNQISANIEEFDFFDLEVFDQSEIWGHVISNTVIGPLAKTLFPDNPLKQQRFKDLYMARFLANVAHMYVGDDKLLEEAVNSEPYVLKQYIEMGTAAHPNDENGNPQDEPVDVTEDSAEVEKKEGQPSNEDETL